MITILCILIVGIIRPLPKHSTVYPVIAPVSIPIRTNLQPSVVDIINKNNQSIHSLVSKISVQVNSKAIKLSGILAYQQDRNFRMQINSFAGKELDIGSNQDIFWFYSRRMKPTYLYYSRYEDLNKTRLKSVFHPLWLMDSLGVRPLAIEQWTNSDRYIQGCQDCVGVSGEQMIKVILINPQKPAIIGHYLFDTQSTIIASAEVVAFNVVPTQILFTWHEEKQTMTMWLNETKINAQLPDSYWQMPHIKNTLDMGRELH